MTPSLNHIYTGECIETMKTWPDNLVDTIICDPPYELNFMSKRWDASGIAFNVDVWKECLRVAKPGAMLLAFGGDRTHHRLMVAIEDAGWEIRTCIHWLFASGFPKSLNISKAIDNRLGIERQRDVVPEPRSKLHGDRPWMNDPNHRFQSKTPITDLAKQWEGWGTALKPAAEIIVLAMKPLDGTFAENAEKWGVAGINVDGGRIGTETRTYKGSGAQPNKLNNHGYGDTGIGLTDGRGKDSEFTATGRWPANLILDEESAAALDGVSGATKSSGGINGGKLGARIFGKFENDVIGANAGGLGDSGGASRFFFIARGDASCGQEKLEADDMFAGKNAENKNGNLNTDGSGNEISGRFLLTTISITETATRLIMSFPILSVLTDSLIGIFTIDAVKPIESLDQLSIESVSGVPNGEHWTITTRDRQVLLAGTAKIVAVNISESGTTKTDPITTPICGPTTQSLRMFYVAKSCRAERNEGCDGMEEKPKPTLGEFPNDPTKSGATPRANHHPTVKPLELMKYLCMLTKTPTGGIVLDPFCGSGTTLWAAEFHNRPWIGIEMNPEYVAIANARIARERSQMKMAI